jgi:hypothetical protein
MDDCGEAGNRRRIQGLVNKLSINEAIMTHAVNAGETVVLMSRWMTSGQQPLGSEKCGDYLHPTY